MDKRFFLTLLLTAIVSVGTPFLFPNSRRTPVRTVDSAQVRASRADSGTPASSSVPAPGIQAAVTAPATTAPQGTASGAVTATAAERPETTVVDTRLATYAFSSHGAA